MTIKLPKFCVSELVFTSILKQPKYGGQQFGKVLGSNKINSSQSFHIGTLMRVHCALIGLFKYLKSIQFIIKALEVKIIVGNNESIVHVF